MIVERSIEITRIWRRSSLVIIIDITTSIEIDSSILGISTEILLACRVYSQEGIFIIENNYDFIFLDLE